MRSGGLQNTPPGAIAQCVHFRMDELQAKTGSGEHSGREAKKCLANSTKRMIGQSLCQCVTAFPELTKRKGTTTRVVPFSLRSAAVYACRTTEPSNTVGAQPLSRRLQEGHRACPRSIRPMDFVNSRKHFGHLIGQRMIFALVHGAPSQPGYPSVFRTMRAL